MVDEAAAAEAAATGVTAYSLAMAWGDVGGALAAAMAQQQAQAAAAAAELSAVEGVGGGGW